MADADGMLIGIDRAPHSVPRQRLGRAREHDLGLSFRTKDNLDVLGLKQASPAALENGFLRRP